jgi:hypothetical protein
LSRVKTGATFIDFNLPIIDKHLIHTIHTMANKKGRTFGGPSDLNNMELIDRHKRRDRSEVIAARSQSLVRKRGITVDDKL